MRVQIKLKHAELLQAIREFVESNSNLVGSDGVPEEATITIFDDGANEFAALITAEEKLTVEP